MLSLINVFKNRNIYSKKREWKELLAGLFESMKIWFRILQKRINIFLKTKIFARIVPYKKYIVIGVIAVSLLSFGVFVAVSDYFPYDIKSLLVLASQNKLYENAYPKSLIEYGMGQLTLHRNEDIDYVVKENDTLHGLAYQFNLQAFDIRLYNNLSLTETLVPGQNIKIPTTANIRQLMNSARRTPVGHLVSTTESEVHDKDILPDELHISVRTQSRGNGITAFFSINTKILGKNIQYQWDLGNGNRISQKIGAYTYTLPGLYKVMLTLQNSKGERVESNKLYVHVSQYGMEYKNDRLYITVNNVGDIFPLDGELIESVDLLGKIKKPVQFIEKIENVYYYQTEASGYFRLKYKEKYRTILVSLFVSPLDSVHTDRMDIDWYETQYGTGQSNCGPTSAAMAIKWANGSVVPVEEIRNFVGWTGKGGTSMRDLQQSIALNGVDSIFTSIRSAEDLFNIIDRQNIAIIGYNCGMITDVEGNMQDNLFGTYYTDAVGHYSVLKGYTKDGKYLIVFDPIPGDWGGNGIRYGDGMSMIGRNRYYPVAEFFNANSTGTALEIFR